MGKDPEEDQQDDGERNKMTTGRATSDRRVRSGGRAVERRTVNRGDDGSIPPTAVSKLRPFRSPHICLYRSEENEKKEY